MTRRRVSYTKPGDLTAAERKVVSDVVQESNSDYRVKVGSVPTVVGLALNPGAIVYSIAEERIFVCDSFGWSPKGVPIVLKVEYTDTQFNFKFKAPATSTLEIHDGDGTVTDAPGADDTNVIHETNYAAAGVYYFSVTGDVDHLTKIDVSDGAGHEFVSGEISGWSRLNNLEEIYSGGTPVYGDIGAFANSTSLVGFFCVNNKLSGDISKLVGLTNLTNCNFGIGPGVTGDISYLNALTGTNFTNLGTSITFDRIVSWNAGAHFFFQDCNWTSRMVDNCLISLANGNTTGIIINLGGNNAPRTSASDAAFAIVDAANTLTVNE